MRTTRRPGPLITPHGDRKLVEAPRHVTLAFVLITPHGDRKRDGQEQSQEVSQDSLPLMGIGNDRSLHPSHYPSWGSETRGLAEGPAGTRSAHYPSWGSETGAVQRELDYLKRSLPLMGIGNAGRSTLFPGSLPAHYPSWGSETNKEIPNLGRYENDSLPLMGIGNR